MSALHAEVSGPASARPDSATIAGWSDGSMVQKFGVHFQIASNCIGTLLYVSRIMRSLTPLFQQAGVNISMCVHTELPAS